MNIDVLNPIKTMSSLEIVKIINNLREDGQAELKHDNFLKKIAKVLGSEGVVKFYGTYIHPQNGQNYPCYNLPKREAQLMVMSESYKVQAAVYDRMVELEQQKPAFDPMQTLNDPSAMRGILLTYTEKVLALQATVQAIQPKADAFDRIASSEGSLNITLTAKTLQMQPKN